MGEPVSIAQILGAIEVASASDVAELFLAAWDRERTGDGLPSTLPVGWRTQVQSLIEMGLTARQIEVCAALGASVDDVSPARRFAYSIGCGRRAAGRLRDAAARSAAHGGDEESRSLVLNVQADVVHHPTCASLDGTNPLSLMRVGHVAPFRPCLKCQP